jgi:hypothetical protein
MLTPTLRHELHPLFASLSARVSSAKRLTGFPPLWPDEMDEQRRVKFQQTDCKPIVGVHDRMEVPRCRYLQ